MQWTLQSNVEIFIFTSEACSLHCFYWNINLFFEHMVSRQHDHASKSVFSSKETIIHSICKRFHMEKRFCHMSTNEQSFFCWSFSSSKCRILHSIECWTITAFLLNTWYIRIQHSYLRLTLEPLLIYVYYSWVSIHRAATHKVYLLCWPEELRKMKRVIFHLKRMATHTHAGCIKTLSPNKILWFAA